MNRKAQRRIAWATRRVARIFGVVVEQWNVKSSAWRLVSLDNTPRLRRRCDITSISNSFICFLHLDLLFSPLNESDTFALKGAETLVDSWGRVRDQLRSLPKRWPNAQQRYISLLLSIYRRDTDMRKASIYGKCIMVDYNAVHKDKCLAEFLQLKNCYLVR